MKVLVATDGSASSDAAVDAVARRPWPGGTEVRVVFALDASEAGEIPDPPLTHAEALRLADHAAAEQAIRRAVERLRRRGQADLAVAGAVLVGSPARAVVQAAREWPADFVFVGCHDHTGIARLLHGSVSRAVADHAGCSVEVVRGDDEAAEPAGAPPAE